VKARSSCCAGKIFDQLRRDIARDIEERNALRPENAHYAFSLTPDHGKLVVSINTNQLHDLVIFTLTSTGTSVHEHTDKLMFDALLTVNDQRECRFEINGQEYEFWQMRKKALEKLFFETV
jgi:hypothetical protein